MSSLSDLLRETDFNSIPVPDCLMSVTVKLDARPVSRKKMVVPKVRRTDGRLQSINKMKRSSPISVLPRHTTARSHTYNPLTSPPMAQFSVDQCQYPTIIEDEELDMSTYSTPTHASVNSWHYDNSVSRERMDSPMGKYNLGAVPKKPVPAFTHTCLHCSRAAMGPVRFVTDPDRRRRWISSLLDADDLSDEYFYVAQAQLGILKGEAYLCRAHFRAEDFVIGFGKSKLRAEALPSSNFLSPELMDNNGVMVNADDEIDMSPFNFSSFEEALYKPHSQIASYQCFSGIR